MIIHELFSRHLRLSNFMWKMAWSIRTCEKFGCEVSYPEHYWLWNYLQNPPKTYPATVGEYPEDLILHEPPVDYILRPRRWEYNKEEEEWIDSHAEDFKNKTVSVALNFFFQNFDCFKGYEQEVYEFFQFKQEEVDKVKNKYEHFFTKPSILLSVRLGDMKFHGDFARIPPEWYIKCLNQEFPSWRDEYNVCVTSDHIEDAKQIFKDYPFLYAEPNGSHTHQNKFKDYHKDVSEHLILGTLFEDYIISQSTFSVWCAWLGTYKAFQSKVIHSGKVFNPKGNHAHCDTSNYYHPSWVKLEI